MTGPTDQQAPEVRPEPRVNLVHVLAFATVILGIAMIVRALTSGGGLGSYGVLVGGLFLAAGLLRLRLLSARSRNR